MDKNVKHGRTIAMHWTDKRIEGVVCCVQRSRTFCGHSLDFPPHSYPPSPLGLFLCKHGTLANFGLTWNVSAFSASSLQHITHYSLLCIPLRCTPAAHVFASGASLCVPPPLKGLSVLLQQDQQLTWCQCHALQAAHCSAAHLHQVTELVIVCQCTLRTHDQLSTTLQKQKKPSIFD